MQLLRLLRAKKGVQQIALGFALGFFPCWFPTFGVGPILSVGLARLFKSSIAASLLSASIGSFVWIFLFYLDYITGKFIVSLFQKPIETIPDPEAVLEMDYGHAVEQVFSLKELFTGSLIFGLIGGIINGLICILFMYWACKWIIIHYRHILIRWLKR